MVVVVIVWREETFFLEVFCGWVVLEFCFVLGCFGTGDVEMQTSGIIFDQTDAIRHGNAS